MALPASDPDYRQRDRATSPTDTQPHLHAVGERPHVVIVGGGFGGLMTALSLRDAPVRVTLIDRHNHHLFQPLLYQVATAALSPSQIAVPIRHIVARQPNCTVWMAEVTGIDIARRRVQLSDGAVPFDYLVLATGATQSYFGHNEWARHAPGLKTIEDAIEIRQRVLLAFEEAERIGATTAAPAPLTFVVIGGGPTGVELAGAISEIAFRTVQCDFHHVRPEDTRVMLVEASDRLLPGFPDTLARRAAQDLAELGVTVRLGCRVTAITAQDVQLHGPQGDERIVTHNVLWAAGVKASPLGAALGAPTDTLGRVRVTADLSIPNHPNVFVIGDLACSHSAADGQPAPAVAPAALQMGQHVAGIIAAETQTPDASAKPTRPSFSYRDRGMLATIGRKRAVAALGPFRFGGFAAWMVWCVVHVMFLITFRQRVIVMIEWLWSYMTFTGGARLISGTQSSNTRPRE
ncbi:MAG: NAD(P)/FAD-dependent oxidoreductase [Nitrospiraceae bacterium]